MFSWSQKFRDCLFSLNLFLFHICLGMDLTNDESETTENTSEHSQVMGFFIKINLTEKPSFQPILFVVIKHLNVSFILRVNNCTLLQGKETRIYSVNLFKQHKLCFFPLLGIK